MRAAGGQHGKKNQGGKRWRNKWRFKENGAVAEEDANLVIEESKLSVKELESLRQAESRLKKDEVYRLKSRSNPGALYACALLSVELWSIPPPPPQHHDFKVVINDFCCQQERQEEVMLTEIRPPGPEQVSAVTSALEAVVQEHGISDQDVEKRRCVVSVMQELLQSVLPGEPPKNNLLSEEVSVFTQYYLFIA
uniref:Terminal uridylyltransferase 4/7 nucleotidyltransferase domain-containing protein n=1 Tax=Oryzias latipes TaxID=8090 RepID=A0A3P9KF24_ORYLA